MVNTLYNEAIKSARLNAGYSQKEVAEALRVSQPYVAKIETGQGSEPSIDRLVQLADLYHITIDQLVGRQ